ncbi:CPBP family intramembrane glutamic endopeptidase [Apilactobacillus kunkeei]|uniref:CPBP family intramembrane glutamic endopeptidase n=1 Tax=Apilactobacillus kunkeei TaxID=148814 RepID=UPI00200A4840|nr:type II CAAX endopeptidase family protein [Apilactobacillus kunkeei]MCK8620275.1 CPBP family intramembrane metalloprotease [Apilactobacillus kunkeei]MCK8626650.1 CPBP family intramembrane metalloprotease [Apilactobacillus kunkeei]
MKKTSFIFILIFLSPLMELARYPILYSTDEPFSYAVIEILVSFVILITIILYLYDKIIINKVIDVFRNNHFNFRLVVIGIELLLLEVSFVLLAINPHENFQTNLSRLIGYTDPKLQLLCIIASLTLSPIIVELFFRGLIQSFIKDNFSEKYAILFSSVIYGISHSLFSIISLSYYILAGVLLGKSREESNGIIAPIVLHCSWDILILLMLWIY